MRRLSTTKRGIHVALCMLVSFVLVAVTADQASAREIRYQGQEVPVYVKPGEPTQLQFPGRIQGGFKRENSAVLLEKTDNYLIVFAQPQMIEDGEVILVHLDDSRSYSIRLRLSDANNQRDGAVEIVDTRPPPLPETAEEKPDFKVGKFAPPSRVAGFMRQMILTAEFGKRKAIPGYRRSNRFSGEVVLKDGAIEATIDEIYIGSNYWGYVISVENKLNTNQTLNPATFRLDGTRAVSMSTQQLAPVPLTNEQKIANAHKGKIYVITRAKQL